MIRKLMKEEYKNAINLSYQVCIECGINDFTEEGIETFKSFVYDTSLMNTLDIYGAFDNHLLIGIIGVHRERQHISGILKNRKFLIRNNSCIMCCLCQHLIPLFDVSPDNKSSVIFVQFIKMVSNLMPVCLEYCARCFHMRSLLF